MFASSAADVFVPETPWQANICKTGTFDKGPVNYKASPTLFAWQENLQKAGRLLDSRVAIRGEENLHLLASTCPEERVETQ